MPCKCAHLSLRLDAKVCVYGAVKLAQQIEPTVWGLVNKRGGNDRHDDQAEAPQLPLPLGQLGVPHFFGNTRPHSLF